MQNSTTLLVNELAYGEPILDKLLNAGPNEELLSREGGNGLLVEFNQVCAKARQAWAQAVFSDAGTESLQRYFTYHLQALCHWSARLEKLSAITVTACSCLTHEMPLQPAVAQTNLMIGHLLLYFAAYPDKNILVPLSYRAYCAEIIAPEVSGAIASLASADIHPVLRSALGGYLDLLNADKTPLLTFKQLAYFQLFVKEFNGLFRGTAAEITERLADKLLELEYNHFLVFTYFQDRINDASANMAEADKSAFLKTKAGQFKTGPKTAGNRYDERWPPLTEMLSDWLFAEIDALKMTPKTSQMASAPLNFKLKLEMSVAHLACLLRLITKEGLFGQLPLTDLFKFICENFSTKRTDSVSNGGLSKAYYSVTQVIAAEVKDMLLKMVQRINHDYFPVVAAISVIIFGC